jgi:hypothetical protein
MEIIIDKDKSVTFHRYNAEISEQDDLIATVCGFDYVTVEKNGNTIRTQMIRVIDGDEIILATFYDAITVAPPGLCVIYRITADYQPE